jgi:hypothetical protein
VLSYAGFRQGTLRKAVKEKEENERMEKNKGVGVRFVPVLCFRGGFFID